MQAAGGGKNQWARCVWGIRVIVSGTLLRPLTSSWYADFMSCKVCPGGAGAQGCADQAGGCASTQLGVQVASQEHQNIARDREGHLGEGLLQGQRELT